MNEETEKIITEDANKVFPSTKPALRTMKSDMQEYINQQKMSMVDIAGKQAVKQGLKISGNYEPNKNKFITLAVIILIMISVGVFAFVVLLKNKTAQKEPGSQVRFPASVISSDKQEFVTLEANNQQNNKNKIKEIIGSDIKIGNITDFVFIDGDKHLITPELFFKYSGVNTPLGFSSFLTDKFMFGVYGADQNKPFIILKISSFENSLAVMLKWEKTISSDIKEIMPVSEASSGSKFQDKIIKNHDTRILYSESGQTVLLYSFLDKDTLVMTLNNNTFEEILRRQALSSI